MTDNLTIRWGFIGCGEVTEKKSGPAFSAVKTEAQEEGTFSCDGKCICYAPNFVIEHYKTEKPKGEFVIIVGGKSEQEEEITFEKAVEMARSLMQSGMSVSFAAKEIANSTPYKKGDIYKALL